MCTLFMLTRNVYVVQPYRVGANRKPLAIGIPHEISKECEIDTSTVFQLKVDGKDKKVTIQTVRQIQNPYSAENERVDTKYGIESVHSKELETNEFDID